MDRRRRLKTRKRRSHDDNDVSCAADHRRFRRVVVDFGEQHHQRNRRLEIEEEEEGGGGGGGNNGNEIENSLLLSSSTTCSSSSSNYSNSRILGLAKNSFVFLLVLVCVLVSHRTTNAISLPPNFNKNKNNNNNNNNVHFLNNETNHILTERQIREETIKFKRILNEDTNIIHSIISGNNNNNDELMIMESSVDTKFAHYVNKSQMYPVINQTSPYEDILGDEDKSSLIGEDGLMWPGATTLAATILITSSESTTTRLGGGSSDRKEVYSLAGKIVLSCLAATASLITVCGNLLVMLSFFLDRQIRNPTNYFILSLSVSDFLIGLISMPFLTFYLMLGYWPFGKIICNLWLSLDYTVCLTSIYTVLFITIDRFCSVRMPAKYRNWRTPDKIIIMVAFTWICPMLLFFTSIFGWSFTLRDEPYETQCDVAWASNKVFSFVLVVAYFWSTLIVIIVLYIFIYQVARNLERKNREKQRKLSSLVGASASNTGALVSVVALPNQVNAEINRLKKSSQQLQQNPLGPNRQIPGIQGFVQTSEAFLKPSDAATAASRMSAPATNQMKEQASHYHRESPDSPEDQDEQDEFVASQTAKLNKVTSKKRKKSDQLAGKVGASSSANAKSAVIFKNNAGSPATHNATGHSSAGSTFKNILKNSNTGVQSATAANKGKLLGEKANLATNNHSFASSTVSNNDDFSSSYESHSDYDLQKKQQQQQQQQQKQQQKQQQAMAKKMSHAASKNAAAHQSTTSKATSSGGGGASKNSIVAAMMNQQKSPKQSSHHTHHHHGHHNHHHTSGALVTPAKEDSQCSSPQVLKPRPESLAVMTNDQFAEKCVAKQSSNVVVNTANNSATIASILPASQSPSNYSVSMQSDKRNLIENEKKEDHVAIEKPIAFVSPQQQQQQQQQQQEIDGDTSKKEAQIPFIDDELEELSYVLTRRHIVSNSGGGGGGGASGVGDKDTNKMSIKEEKILIKSPLKSSFFRKFSSPIKHRMSSRRSSQKSQNNDHQHQHQQQQNGTVPTTPTPPVIAANGTLNRSVVVMTPTTPQPIDSSSPAEPANNNNALVNNDENNEDNNDERANLLDNVNNSNNGESVKTLGVISSNQPEQTAATTIQGVNSTNNKITPSSTFTAITVSNSSPIHAATAAANNAADNSKQPENATTTITTTIEETNGKKTTYADTIQKSVGMQLTPPKTTTTTTTMTSSASQTMMTRGAFGSGAPLPPARGGPGLPNKRKNKHENRARKALRTITFILGAFILCFAPWHVVSIYSPFCPECFDSTLFHHFFYSCYFLCYLNSPVNPFMYALANQQFKKVFLRILRGDFRRI